MFNKLEIKPGHVSEEVCKHFKIIKDKKRVPSQHSHSHSPAPVMLGQCWDHLKIISQHMLHKV